MAPLPTCLLFMDESECKDTDIFALVGLFVPIEKADPIRLDHQRFIRSLSGTPDRTIDFNPLELHGRNMLRHEKTKAPLTWATDEHRFRCFEFVADVVNRYALEVLRVAYYRKSLEKLPGAGPKCYGLCFAGFQWALGEYLASSYVIPVMDGLDGKVAITFGRGTLGNSIVRAVPWYEERFLTVKNSANLMDAVFVDSRYSPLMQIADVTTYLLHVLDWERENLPIDGDYKPRLLSIAKTLNQDLVQGGPPVWMRVTDATKTNG